jgi:hypothetical protein
MLTQYNINIRVAGHSQSGLNLYRLSYIRNPLDYDVRGIVKNLNCINLIRPDIENIYINLKHKHMCIFFINNSISLIFIVTATDVIHYFASPSLGKELCLPQEITVEFKYFGFS